MLCCACAWAGGGDYAEREDVVLVLSDFDLKSCVLSDFDLKSCQALNCPKPRA